MTDEPPTDSQTSGFKSFTLTVQKRTTIEITALPVDHHDSDEDGTEEPEIKRSKLTHFVDGVMITDEVKPKAKGPLVINPVISKDWRLKQLQEKEENGTINETDGTNAKAITLDLTDEIPEDADYSKVSIEDFGMGILRGQGFQESVGIGKTNKQVVNVKRQERRVKNLGLGATVAAEEDLKNLKVGSKVLITSGSSAEKYGIIESIDGDNVCCYIKLALTKNIVKISQLIVKLVSSKDYEQNSKILNKKAFDAAREKQQILLEQEQKGENVDRKQQQQGSYDRKIYKRSPSRSLSPSSKPWASENLRVRVINKEYKRGEYYKSKMVVIEASDRNNCLLRDEDELKEKWIETVIPKGKGGKVMVLAGKYRGSVGRIIDRDDKRYKVWVALHELDDVVKVDFDDACEYVGYVQDLDLHED
uniref:KOW domain-containing protein n=1 Tax=Panagrolaimus superbus TaxID=310955 RepID=A0A914Y8F8_9BILA